MKCYWQQQYAAIKKNQAQHKTQALNQYLLGMMNSSNLSKQDTTHLLIKQQCVLANVSCPGCIWCRADENFRP